jgi:hypothetical protein
MLLLASAGKFAVISILGDVDASGAEALATAFDWLDGESVIIVSLESCSSIDAPAVEALLPKSAEPQVVYVLPVATRPRLALRIASALRELNVADDLEGAVRLAATLEGARLRPFHPLPAHLN